MAKSLKRRKTERVGSEVSITAVSAKGVNGAGGAANSNNNNPASDCFNCAVLFLFLFLHSAGFYLQKSQQGLNGLYGPDNAIRTLY
jgi:hypothetical protein